MQARIFFFYLFLLFFLFSGSLKEPEVQATQGFANLSAMQARE
jgi:hypothetical protein